MSHRKHPSEALLKDLKKVFEKHNWSGNAIGIAVSPAARKNMSPPASSAIAANVGGCIPPQTLQYYKYELPDGTVVFKTYCA